jgi:hypothetical protein
VQTNASLPDQEAYHVRFATPSTIAKETEKARREIHSRLNATGITPFAPNDENYDWLYLRIDVEGIF